MQAIDQYGAWQKAKGLKRSSYMTTRFRLVKFLRRHETRSLASITGEMASTLYASFVALVPVDSHRNMLNETKTFMNWCVSKGWIKRNPFERVEGVGKRKKGKPQLRIDESIRYLNTAFALASKGDIAGIVGAGALYFGTRITEMVSRPVRDLDNNGWIFWVPDSKTENGKRFLDVPEDLRPHLLRLTAGRPGDAPLFPGPRRGKAITRHTAYGMVKRICRLAGVPEVSPHGLRGTHASISRERGTTPRAIAAALGQGSYEAVTKRHYVEPGVDERAQQKAVFSLLQQATLQQATGGDPVGKRRYDSVFPKL